jgi:hypothetical protein
MPDQRRRVNNRISDGETVPRLVIRYSALRSVDHYPLSPGHSDEVCIPHQVGWLRRGHSVNLIVVPPALMPQAQFADLSRNCRHARRDPRQNEHALQHPMAPADRRSVVSDGAVLGVAGRRYAALRPNAPVGLRQRRGGLAAPTQRGAHLIQLPCDVPVLSAVHAAGQIALDSPRCGFTASPLRPGRDCARHARADPCSSLCL